jgi:beta-N-acetylhexosaminidase
MVDIRGPALDAEERERLRHPRVGGVILFTRNYVDRAQLRALVEEIHALRSPRLIVAVDHEGGPVQRFRAGFTRLPAASVIGARDHDAPQAATRLAEDSGWIMAAELRAVGVDLSLAPVLDVRAGVSAVVNDRAFHADVDVISRLARAYMRGMQAAGMVAVGKHFPGHGSVAADSHHEVAVDPRPLADLRLRDLVPFARLIEAGLAGIMPAHVVYPEVDPRPAGFSPVWLQQILRGELRFHGTIFSDDIVMAGAAVAGPPVARAQAALAAGCDMVLVCNDPAAAVDVIDHLDRPPEPAAQVRLMRLHGRQAIDDAALAAMDRWRRVSAALAALDDRPELDLGDDRNV